MGVGGAVISACLGAVAVLCYANSMHGAFVFDDHGAITQNADVTSAATVPLSSLWHNDYWGTPLLDKTSHKSWRPLTTLTFRLNAAQQQRQQGASAAGADPTTLGRGMADDDDEDHPLSSNTPEQQTTCVVDVIWG